MQQLRLFKMKDNGFWLPLKPFAYFIFLLILLHTICISNDDIFRKKYEFNTSSQISDKTEAISEVTIKHSQATTEYQ